MKNKMTAKAFAFVIAPFVFSISFAGVAGFAAETPATPGAKPGAAQGTMKAESPTGEANFQFTYQVEVPQPAAAFKEMDVWVPMPSDTPEQTIVKSEIATSVPYTIATEPQSGNKMFFIRLDNKQKFPLKIVANYTVARKPAGDLKLSQVGNSAAWDPKNYLASDKKVPLTGVIAKLGEEHSKGAANDDAKIEMMFNYVTSIMTYNKDGTGWGQGDAIWACDNKRGNCTDFHSLLIGMDRSQKIPAKFEMGFPIPDTAQGPIGGYHCWMRAYSKDKGWIPMDSSEAKKSGNSAKFFGKLPPDRVQFSNGRDLALVPHQKGDALNYFIYPYAEVDGKPSTDLKREFSFKRF